MSKKEIIKQAEHPLAETKQVTGLADNITQNDMRLPRIELTQAKSPTVEEGIHKAGILINSLTKEELKSPLIIPVMMFKNVIRWRPRSEGGGIIYKTTHITPEVAEDLKWKGDQKPLATAYLNAICLVEGADMPLVASFCNTSYKAGQDLATLIHLSGLAWKYTYFLGTKKITNNMGSFYVFTVARGALTTNEQKKQAAELYESVKKMATLDVDYEVDAPIQADIATNDGL